MSQKRQWDGLLSLELLLLLGLLCLCALPIGSNGR
jgi:hypothetical protein